MQGVFLFSNPGVYALPNLECDFRPLSVVVLNDEVVQVLRPLPRTTATPSSITRLQKAQSRHLQLTGPEYQSLFAERKYS
jgi:hypothetical protein